MLRLMVLFQSLKGQIKILILWVLDLRLSGLSAAPRAGGWFPDLLKLSLSVFFFLLLFPFLFHCCSAQPDSLSFSQALLPFFPAQGKRFRCR